MKKRVISFIICIMTMLSGLPDFFVVNADAIGYDSIADIMGNEMEAVSSLNFQFGNGFNAEREHISTPEGALYGANGLDLTGVTAPATQASWRYKPENGWEIFEHGDAVFLRAKAQSNGGSLNVQFYHSNDQGDSFRYYMNISETGFSVSNVKGSPAGDFTFVPGSDWADYFIKKNEDDGFSVFVNAATTQNQWKHYLTVSGDSWKTSSSNAIGIAVVGAYEESESCGGYVKEIVVLQKSSLDFDQYHTTYLEDFESIPQYSNYTLSSGIISGGELVLDGTDGKAIFSLESGEIPEGGCIAFKVKNGASSMISMDDASRCLSFEPDEFTDPSSGEYFDWIITKNIDGTFSGYYRKEEGGFWHSAFESEYGVSSSGAKEISFSVEQQTNMAENGSLVIDSIEILARDLNGSFVITDGAGGRILKSGMSPQMMDSVVVTVKPDVEKPRVLLVGVYDENGVLADSLVSDVPMGEKSVMFVCNAEKNIKNIRKLRVFLWSRDEELTPYDSSVTITGNMAAWTDVWETSGYAYADYDALVLKGKAGGEGTAVLETEIGSQFDISWDMTVNQFGDGEYVQIDNGIDKISFKVNEDGISYGLNSREVFLPWVINSVGHTYRLIGDGTRYLLYIDGYFVGEISGVAESDEIEKISFSNQGNSLMRIDRVFLDSFSETNVPAQGFYDDFEADECGWTLLNPTFNNGVVGEFWKVEDGNLKVADEHIALDYTTYCVSEGFKEITEIGDEFLIQTKLAFPSFGTRSYIMVWIDGRCFALDMREKFFSFKTIVNSSNVALKSSDEISVMGSDYHILTMESYNHKKNVRIYLDGKLILDDVTEAYSGKNNQIRIMMDGGFLLPAALNIDYIKYSPKNYDICITPTELKDFYYVGENISFSATEKTEFVLNGVSVANGTNVTLSDLPAGTYQLEAKTEKKSSNVIQFTVKNDLYAKVKTESDADVVSVSLEDISGFDSVSVSAVNYLLDGRKVAEGMTAPYNAVISGILSGNHTIEAVCYDAQGTEVGRFGEEFSVLKDNTTNAYSYLVSYMVPEKGTVDVMNGNHHLQMSHKSTGLRYLTDEGVESYNDGKLVGKFDVLTDGPVAEVYKNGQFVLSFIMPKTTEISTAISDNISNFNIEIPRERKNYFSTRNINVQKKAYELFNLDHNHNLDFVANASDEAHITLNDGYFRNDISIQDGSLYVWTVERNNSDPKLTKVATMTEDDVYYRVETAAGMSRIYADGRWVYTFRNANATGKRGVLAVDVSKGDGLSFLGVNSNADLYFYQDSFDGSGDADSIDYWSATGCDVFVNSEYQALSISSEKENAITELNAYIGNGMISADVIVEKNTEGFWFISNHCVSEAYTKVGYNFLTNSYEVVRVTNGNETLVMSKAGSFPEGNKANVSLLSKETLNGINISFLVDGHTVLSSEDVIHSRGTIGFCVSKGSALVDNVYFRGDAKPMLDVRTTVLENAPNALDMIETEEKTYLVTQFQTGYYTTNGGKTWETFTLSANQGFGPSGFGGMSKNMVQLKSGEIISMHRNAPISWTDAYGQRKIIYQAFVSTDNGRGMTWYKPGNANFPEKGQLSGALVGRDATVNRITQGPSGRVYFVYGEGNSEDYGDAVVWMSDNEGRNWFQTNTKISAIDTGFVIAEAVVIETTKSTRLYFRTDKGQLCYFESNDRGVTWDLTPHSTPFISSMTCFGLEADPENPDVLYIAWGYDNINLFARAQFPRTRWAVAKSIDGGDSWEMIGTAHENTSVLTQGMNRSLNVGKDYVYLNGATADSFGSQSDGFNRVIAFPKDKQKPSLRMEQLHLKELNHIENAKLVSDQQNELCMQVNFADNSIVIRNQRIEDAAMEEYISLDVASSFVGASSAKVMEDGSVEFVIGGHDVTKFGCDVKAVSEKNFIKLSSFVEKMGLNMFDVNGVKIITTEKSLSRRQINSVRYAGDLFSNLP